MDGDGDRPDSDERRPLEAQGQALRANAELNASEDHASRNDHPNVNANGAADTRTSDTTVITAVKQDAPGDSSDAATLDEREVLFLIANYLSKYEGSEEAAQVLIRGMEQHEMLGKTVHWSGRQKSATYADYARRHHDLAPDHLLSVLKPILTANTPSVQPSSVSSTSVALSKSLLLKSRATVQRKKLSTQAQKALQAELIKTMSALRKLSRTETMVTRIVSKYERLRQFLEDAKFESLPTEVRYALTGTSDPSNITELAADVRALRQLLQVRNEISAMKATLQRISQEATNTGALQAAMRTGRNHTSRLLRREISMRATPRLPPSYIYSRVRRLKTLNGHLQIPTYCMTYDKTGKYVITGADDRLIKVWSMLTGDLLFTLRAHVGNITDLSVNHSNTLLASSSDDKTVRVWELRTGAPVAVLVGHTSVVNSVRFHPTQNVVVTASDDGRCYCYKLPEVEPFDEPETKMQTGNRLHKQNAYQLTLRPLYSLSHATHRQNVRSNKVLCLNFSRCGDYVVTGGQDSVGRVWDVSVFSNPNISVVTPRYQPTTDDVVVPATAVGAPNDNGILFPEAELDQIPAPAVPAILPPRILPGESNAMENDEGTADLLAPTDGNQPLTRIPTPIDGEGTASTSTSTSTSTPATPSLGEEVTSNPVADTRRPPQLPDIPHARTPLPSAIADMDVPMLPSNEPIAFLKGHSGPITNILFSHRGDKIATASIKDGTTRVWQWQKNYKKVTHKVLFDEEPDRQHELAVLYGLPSRKRAVPAVDTLSWTRDDERLVTLHSTKPDSNTGEGDWCQRMRIWNPETGALVMTMAAIDDSKKCGHTNAVFAMDTHPTDWRIVVTGGHDGRVFLWDISEGKLLKSFIVTSPEGETVALLDGSFAPDGEGFCFTDRIGRLCIFGTGSGERFAAAPVQQYFNSDYAALLTDRNFIVADRETGTAPSLMESGPLNDMLLVPYPHQPPHLLANRGALTPDQLESNRRKRTKQCMESEIACKVRHRPDGKALDGDNLGDEEDFFPSVIFSRPTSDSRMTGDSSDSPPSFASSSYRLNGDPVLLSELRRRAEWNYRRRNDPSSRRRRSSPTLDDRDTSILNVEISSEDDRSDEDFQAPTNRHRDGDDADGDDDEDDEEDDEDEDELDEDDVLSDASDLPNVTRLRQRRGRIGRTFVGRGRGRRLVDGGEENNGDISGEEASAGGLRTRRQRRVNRGYTRGEGSGGQEDDSAVSRTDNASMAAGGSLGDVVVESNDGFIMGDNQLDRFDHTITYEEMLEIKRQQRNSNGMQDGEPEEPLIACAFCLEGDDGGMLKLPGEAMGVNPLMFSSQRLFVHDQCAIASPLCFNRGGKWYNVAKEIRRGRSLTCVQCKKRGATVGCTIQRCSRSYHWKCAIACGWSTNQMHFYCPEHESERSTGDGGGDGGLGNADDDTREVQQRFGLKFDRAWLQLTSFVGLHQYVPQVGDYVVYFPEGHKQFLNALQLRNPYFFDQVSPFPMLKCRVVNVSYAFPTMTEYRQSKAIRCKVELAVLAVPDAHQAASAEDNIEAEEKVDGGNTSSIVGASSAHLFDPDMPAFSRFVGVDAQLQPINSGDEENFRCSRFTMTLSYYSNDLSNFIVLDHTFENGVAAGWKVGDRVQMPYIELNNHGLEVDSKISFGAIHSIQVRPNITNPTLMSPWESVFVVWDADDEDDCFVSPWELEPAAAEIASGKRERDRQRFATRLYKSRTLSRATKENLTQAINNVITLSIAKDFAAPVDEEYSDYMITIENPIDLSKIRERVECGYYRQIDSFIADVELLQRNCEKYNIPSSVIAQNARNITSSLLSRVQQLFPAALFSSNENPGSIGSHAISTNERLYTYPPNDFGGNEDEDDPDTYIIPSEASVGEIERGNANGVAETSVAEIIPPSSAELVGQVAANGEHAVTNNFGDVNTQELHGGFDMKTVLSAVTATSSRRTRQSTVASSGSPPGDGVRGMGRNAVLAVSRSPMIKHTRKRQRSTEPSVISYDELLQALTSEQRELFDQKTDDDLQSVLSDFHEALMAADSGDIFARPVTEDIAPGYFNAITKPMDFGTILDSIEKFQHFFEYFDQIVLVFTNAITYNGWDSLVGGIVKDLQGYYVKLLVDAIGGERTGSQRSTRAGGFANTKLHIKSENNPSASSQKRKRRAALSIDGDDDDEDETQWQSDSAESADEDTSLDDDDDADDSESEVESDWSGGGPSRRRPVRSTRGRPGKEKAALAGKSRSRAAQKQKLKRKRPRRLSRG